MHIQQPGSVGRHQACCASRECAPASRAGGRAGNSGGLECPRRQRAPVGASAEAGGQGGGAAGCAACGGAGRPRLPPPAASALARPSPKVRIDPLNPPPPPPPHTHISISPRHSTPLLYCCIPEGLHCPAMRISARHHAMWIQSVGIPPLPAPLVRRRGGGAGNHRLPGLL